MLGSGGSRDVMAASRQKPELPVVAMGGTTAADKPAIMATGVSGIALSGTLLGAEDTTAETSKILNLINTNK